MSIRIVPKRITLDAAGNEHYEVLYRDDGRANLWSLEEYVDGLPMVVADVYSEDKAIKLRAQIVGGSYGHEEAMSGAYVVKGYFHDSEEALRAARMLKDTSELDVVDHLMACGRQVEEVWHEFSGEIDFVWAYEVVEPLGLRIREYVIGHGELPSKNWVKAYVAQALMEYQEAAASNALPNNDIQFLQGLDLDFLTKPTRMIVEGTLMKAGEALMNIDNINKAIAVMERVKRNGGEVNMGSWQFGAFSRVETCETEEELNHCGSAACFAGWVAVSPEFKEAGGFVTGGGMPEIPLAGKMERGLLGEDAIAAWLGISLKEADGLCYTGGDDLCSVYGTDDCSEVTAEQVLEALYRLRDTGTVFPA